MTARLMLGLIAAVLLPALAVAQSREVRPDELGLTVEVEETAHTPVTREMVLITIRGIYRRHITRETLVQPDFEGFNWTQLGNDLWREERLDGRLVKTFTRRMAVFPDRAGTLTIGAFTHSLTLTDENDDWFEHDIVSEPVSLQVAPAPETADWWFPVRRLRIEDNWSNAPDQLQPGEGVLRVVRIEALGVTPEMIPPMPELTSPSAMIFPHPEQRFVELSPEGPVTYAFWRWTIRPSNDVSAIVAPFGFTYFDTESRVQREVTISAQRIAYGQAVPDAPGPPAADYPAPARLPGWPLAALALVVSVAGAALALRGRRLEGWAALHRFGPFDPLARRLRRAARQGDLPQTRRAAAALLARDGTGGARARLLADFDAAVFDPSRRPGDPMGFARDFLRAG